MEFVIQKSFDPRISVPSVSIPPFSNLTFFSRRIDQSIDQSKSFARYWTSPITRNVLRLLKECFTGRVQVQISGAFVFMQISSLDQSHGSVILA